MSNVFDEITQLSADKRQLFELLLREEGFEDSQLDGSSTKETQVPLSFAQQRLWFLDQLVPGNTFYNGTFGLRMTGSLIVVALTTSLQTIIKRHEVLRTTYSSLEGDPYQVIHPSSEASSLHFPLYDLSSLSTDAQLRQVHTIAIQEQQRPFDLQQDFQLRVLLLRLKNDEHVLLITVHHIAFDGWSEGIFQHELSILYNSFIEKQSPLLPEISMQYADYARWQRQHLQGTTLQELLIYWKQQLLDLPQLALPTDYTRPPIESFRGLREQIEISSSLLHRLQALARQDDATLFMVLLAAFQIVLGRYSSQEDFAVGVPIANRSQLELENLIGCFVNTLVLRADLSREPGSREVIRRVRERTLDSYGYQELPFEKLVEELQPERDLSRNPLVQTLFQLYNPPQQSLTLAGLALQSLLPEQQNAKCDLSLFLTERDDSLTGWWEYNSDLFTPQRIKRLTTHLLAILEGMVTEPDQSIWHLNILPNNERQFLVEHLNATNTFHVSERCLHELIFEQGQRTPEAIAVVMGQEHLTYEALERHASKLARQLRQVGVGQEDRVGVCMERSIELVVAVLAVFQSGGAYVPLDPSYPPERLAFMAVDANIAALLTTASQSLPIDPRGRPVLRLDPERADLAHAHASPLSSPSSPHQLAYVIYTSGSTGTPKGVQIQHDSLINFLRAMQNQPGMTAHDTLLAVTTLSFDIAGLELFLPLLVGARLEIAPREVLADAERLQDLVEQSGATMMQATPATWRLLLSVVHRALPRLKALCGGEALSRELADHLLSQVAELWNLYGPTETTIWSSRSQVQSGEPYVPLGTPIEDTQFYLLDRHLEPVPMGIAGELYIGGAGVARGYLNQAALTAERFVPDPFSQKEGRRLYRTGDLASYQADHSLKFLGRTDHQIKLRGYRIETGEIEARLREHPAVQESIVLLQEDGRGEPKLVAYIVADPSHNTLGAELRSHLHQSLPAYMVPASFVVLDAFPLMPNGKINRRVLPSLQHVGQRTSLEAFVAPRTPVEEELARVWIELLQVERVSVHDSFFELGGHSLLAMRLLAQIQTALQVAIPLRVLFEQPTIAGIASFITQHTGEKEPSQHLPVLHPTPDQRYLPFPLTDVQQAYWIGQHAELELGNIATHRYIELECMNLDIERFTNAWQKLIQRHDMLRTIILPGGQQQALPQVPPYEIKVLDLLEQDEETVAAKIAEIRDRMSHQVLPTDQWPLFEICATLLDAEHTLLHMSIDALIIDAGSQHIINGELSQLYENPQAELPPLHITFRDYVMAEVALHSTSAYQEAQRYWQQRIRTLSPAPDLPLVRHPSTLTIPRFTRRSATLPPALWQHIQKQAASVGVTPSSVLLSAFAETLARWSKNPRFTLNLTLFNRLSLHPQVEALVGDFTALSLLEVDLAPLTAFEERARQLQARLWEDLDHRMYSGVQVLRDLARLHTDTTRSAMPVVFTSLLGLQQPEQGEQRQSALLAKAVYSITQTPQVWLDHQTFEQHGALHWNWDAIEDLFPSGLLEAMFDSYTNLLYRLAENADAWRSSTTLTLPAVQMKLVNEYNNTQGPLPTDLLHVMFEQKATQYPQRLAIIASGHRLTYEHVSHYATSIGRWLREHGAQSGKLVAIVMEKGWEQVVAALGVLASGAAYVPLDPDLPQARLTFLLEQAEVSLVLTQSKIKPRMDWPSSLQLLSVDTIALTEADQQSLKPVQTLDDLAYVIYTSGSTGVPKGVMIDHRGAANTILDINQRFHVMPDDKVLALSSLSFDLSVYDIFGILAAGATIVIPDPQSMRDPSQWLQLMQQEVVTLWNSVPALLEVLLEYVSTFSFSLPLSLRLVLLSGDWIPLPLPDRVRSQLPQADVISLGGATEASIWSIFYPIVQMKSEWKSIPYGYALRNQTWFVLNEALEVCPVWVPGRLYIGGVGLAKGYWRDEEKTRARFIVHPHTGERLYNTGDIGRYLPDGTIEFLGREDFQVKVQGYRIELGEIESALMQIQGIRSAVVKAIGDHQDKRLVGYVVLDPQTSLTKEDLRSRLEKDLPTYMVPATIMQIDTLPLSSNGKVDRHALPEPIALPNNDTSLTQGNSLSLQMSRLVAQVLHRTELERDANLLYLGANSIDLIRIINQVEKELHFRPSMATFLRNPTVAVLVTSYIDFQMRQKKQQLRSTQKKDNVVSVLLDPQERKLFKEQHIGQRKFEQTDLRIALPRTSGHNFAGSFTARRSFRDFTQNPLPLLSLSTLLGYVQQLIDNGHPRYLYPSAGGLYPVQVYLHIQPGRLDHLETGTYYYDPVDHSLVSLQMSAKLPVDIHEPFVNQPVFERAAFSLFLIAQSRAIEPMYGSWTRDYCLLEAGYMSQLLMLAAPGCGIGLCPIGRLDFDRIRQHFKLDEGHFLAHSLLGGHIDPFEQAEWTPFQEVYPSQSEREEGEI